MLTEDMRNIVDNARETCWVLEPDAKRLLSLAGLKVPDFTLAATAQEAAAALVAEIRQGIDSIAS